MLKRLAVMAAVAGLAAAPAFALEKAFTATLSAEGDTAQTGSKATAVARIVVDLDTKTVDMTIDVTGLKIADLWDKLVESAFGANPPAQLPGRWRGRACAAGAFRAELC